MSIGPWLEINPVPDDPETFRRSVTAGEWETAATMNSIRRRAEWLAWRAAARKRLGHGISITYDANGAPELEEGLGYLSVSHTKGWSAVVWSPERCAVDVELVSRDVSPASTRFISDEESGLADAGSQLFAISVWCAKEALYKYAGIPGLDLLADIRITSSDIASGRMTGTVKDSEPLEIQLLFRKELVIAIIS